MAESTLREMYRVASQYAETWMASIAEEQLRKVTNPSHPTPCSDALESLVKKFSPSTNSFKDVAMSIHRIKMLEYIVRISYK